MVSPIVFFNTNLGSGGGGGGVNGPRCCGVVDGGSRQGNRRFYGVGPVWPDSVTWTFEEEEEERFFGATPPMVGAGTGVKEVVKVELGVFLGNVLY